MKMWTDRPTGARPLPPKLAAAKLKLCPLCDSLNAKRNETCFVCGWRGAFVEDAHEVHLSLILLLEQYPELAEDADVSPPPPFWKRVWLGTLAIFRRGGAVDFLV